MTLRKGILLFGVLLVVAGSVVVGLLLNIGNAINSEDRSSPSFPKDALVWEKLERATPMFKACGSADKETLSKRFEDGSCSAVVLQGSDFRMVNWNFPVDLDFRKSDSIAMANSTEIMNDLSSRFGGGFIVSLNVAEGPMALDNRIPSDIRDAVAHAPLAEEHNTIGSYTPAVLAGNGRQQLVIYSHEQCDMSLFSCAWEIVEMRPDAKPGNSRVKLFSGDSPLYKMANVTNGYSDLLTTGSWGADINRFDGTVYKQTDCYRRGTGSEPTLVKDTCTTFHMPPPSVRPF